MSRNRRAAGRRLGTYIPPQNGEVTARAPFRIGLAGGGTDISPYCDEFGGCVLNTTVDLYAYARASLRNDGMVALESVDQGVSWKSSVGNLAAGAGCSLPLHWGVYARLMAEIPASDPLPITLSTFSEVPAGSGLGASSTLVVAMTKCLGEFLGIALGERELAELSVDIERRDLGFAGGQQDQYAAAFGGFNFMEFSADGNVLVNPLRVRRSHLVELESTILLYYTGTDRASSRVIEEQQRNIEMRRPETIEALHSVKANAYALKAALLTGRMVDFAQLFSGGWTDKKKVAAGISNSSLDAVFAAALDAGAIGGKLSGAGGGGFIVFLVDPLNRDRVARRLESFGGRVFNAHFVDSGAESWRSQPAAGREAERPGVLVD